MISARIFRIVLFSVLILAGFLLSPLNSAHAQSTSSEVSLPSNYYSPDLNSDVPRDQHTFVQSALIETASAIVCQLGGVDPIRPNQKCLGIDPKTGKIGFAENSGGIYGMITTYMAYTFRLPVSSKDYISYMSNNFGLSQKAYAQQEGQKVADTVSGCFNPDGNGDKQGYGFCGIQPLIGIWIAMRNIAYLLFVIIFVVIGLAIMLRVHIDPRTVMTIENQIPKIIIGILLVTFSFPIAGFLIDVMYVAVYLIGGVLTSLPYFPKDVGLQAIATAPSPPDVLNRLWKGGFFELTAQGQDSFTQIVALGLQNGHAPTSIGLADLLSNIVNAVVVIIVGVFAALFIFLGLIFATLRLWLMMVLSYINILLDIVFAPFWFLVGLLPGSSVGVGPWFKDMLANLAVYPTALSMLILGKIFGEIAKADKGQNFLFTPPLTGAAGHIGTDAFAGVIMLGFIFMTPHVIQITKNAIKAPNINYGPVFQPVGAGAGSFGAGVSAVTTFATPVVPKAGDHGGMTAVFKKWIKA